MSTRIIFFSAALLFQQIASCQKITDSVTVYDFPVKEGKIYCYEKGNWGCQAGCEIISVYSFSDSVFHFEDGKVISVINIKDCYAAVIQNGQDEFIVYSNLKTPFVKKGDRIKKRDCIGIILKDDFDERNSLDFLILKGTKIYSPKKLVEYIKCNISSERSNHYTL